MIADDQAINLRLIEHTLSHLNLEQKAILCCNGQEVIEKVKWLVLEAKTEQPVSVMILDFQMPVKNGLQVVKEVREIF